MKSQKFRVLAVSVWILVAFFMAHLGSAAADRVLSNQESLRRNSFKQTHVMLQDPDSASETFLEALETKPKIHYPQITKLKITAEPKATPEPEEVPELESYVTLTVKITAYCPCVSCCGIWSAEHESRKGTGYIQKTSSGTIPTAGRTIATDPTVIPAGSRVVIDGHEYIAEDTGGGIKGNRIDIYFDSHQEALEWGVQTKEVQVYASN